MTARNLFRHGHCPAAFLVALAAAIMTAAPATAAGSPCVNGELLINSSPAPRLSARVASGMAVRILAIGSSSTEGVGASSLQAAYPARLQAELQAAWPVAVSVRNAGIGGEAAARTLGRLREELDAARYDVVIWQIGTNDALRDIDAAAFRKIVETGIGLVGEAGADLMLVDPQFYPGIRDGQRYAQFVDTIADAARQRKTPVFSRYRMMKSWAERDADGWRALLSGDQFHMNDTGYACLAAGLADSLERLAAARPWASIAR